MGNNHSVDDSDKPPRKTTTERRGTKRHSVSESVNGTPKRKVPRLSENLNDYFINSCETDVHNLFRALSHGLRQTAQYHSDIRILVCDYMREFPEVITSYIDLERFGSVSKYVDHMEKDTPGTVAEILAFCHATKLNVSVCTAENNKLKWEYYPEYELVPGISSLKLLQDEKGHYMFLEDRWYKRRRSSKRTFPPTQTTNQGIWKDQPEITKVKVPKESLRQEILQYHLVPADHVYKKAVMTARDTNSMFRALSLAMELTDEGHKKYRFLVYDAISQKREFCSQFLDREDWQQNDDLFVAKYLWNLKFFGVFHKSSPGKLSDLTVFALRTGYKVRVYLLKEKQWTHEDFPSKEMADSLNWQPKKDLIELHLTGTAEDGHWSLVETSPPSFKESPRICKLPREVRHETKHHGPIRTFCVRPADFYSAVSLAIEGTPKYDFHYKILTVMMIKNNPGVFVSEEYLEKHLKRMRNNCETTEAEMCALSQAMKHNLSLYRGIHSMWVDFPLVKDAKGHVKLYVREKDVDRSSYSAYVEEGQTLPKRDHPVVYDFFQNI